MEETFEPPSRRRRACFLTPPVFALLMLRFSCCGPLTVHEQVAEGARLFKGVFYATVAAYLIDWIIGFGGILIMIFGTYVIAKSRSRIGKVYGIPVDPLGNCCLSFWCGCCAASQVRIVVVVVGGDGSVGRRFCKFWFLAAARASRFQNAKLGSWHASGLSTGRRGCTPSTSALLVREPLHLHVPSHTRRHACAPVSALAHSRASRERMRKKAIEEVVPFCTPEFFPPPQDLLPPPIHLETTNPSPPRPAPLCPNTGEPLGDTRRTLGADCVNHRDSTASQTEPTIYAEVAYAAAARFGRFAVDRRWHGICSPGTASTRASAKGGWSAGRGLSAGGPRWRWAGSRRGACPPPPPLFMLPLLCTSSSRAPRSHLPRPMLRPPTSSSSSPDGDAFLRPDGEGACAERGGPDGPVLAKPWGIWGGTFCSGSAGFDWFAC